MDNKFIRFITSDMRFAVLYIFSFMFVIYMAVFEQAGPHWEEAAWSMLSILGVIIFITAIYSFTEALESKKWPKYNATLIEAYVTSGTTSDNGRVYSPNVRYKYSFQNKSYEGSQIDFSAASASEQWAQRIIDKIKNESQLLKVHVNPLQPDISVIYPGLRFVHFLRFIIGPAMAVAGIVFGFGIVKLT